MADLAAGEFNVALKFRFCIDGITSRFDSDHSKLLGVR